jgi:arsenate reductase-like glutaredoxin family protein
MVVPLVAKYLFSLDPTIKLPDEILNGTKMETEEKTIKALVKEYLENDKDLKNLLSNFDDNWQKIINEKTGNKKRIAQIKDEVLVDKEIANK